MSTEGLEIREFQIRAVDTEKREVSGIAVPWGQVADIGGLYREIIAAGAVQDSSDAKLFWRHDEPIGKITAAKDTEEGWDITAHLSATNRGDEVYTLIKDGVVDRFSIGFEPVEHADETHEDGSITRTRTKIKVREVSLVPFPAYEGARVAQVREATTTNEREPVMATEQFDADLAEVRSTVEDIERKVSLLAEPKEDESVTHFRSYGEYVKALASGDEIAKRVYAGATTGDTIVKDAWIGDLVRLASQKQPVLSEFQHANTLPGQGMSVEYAVLESDTTQVGVQAAQGDDLLFGKVAITTETAPVKTLGGWSSLSRQAIERSSVGVLDTTFQALYLKYARAVELLTRTSVTAGLVGADEVEADLTTQDGVVMALLDLAEHFDDNDQILSGLFVARDVFASLYSIEATDRILQVSQAPTDKVGTLTISSLEAGLAGIKVKVFPGADAGTVFAYDSTAVKTLESPGAPLRLQDENIVNLTKDFSVYGYAASFVQVPAGLVNVVEVDAG